MLSRETGFEREYGENPYVGYEAADAVDEQPFLLEQEADGRLAAKERVITVGDVNGDEVAVVAFSRLEDEPVAQA